MIALLALERGIAFGLHLSWRIVRAVAAVMIAAMAVARGEGR